jgi:chitinase
MTRIPSLGARWSAALAVCLLAASPALAVDRVLVGYYAVFGDLPVEQVPWKHLTHACHAFLRIDAEGKPLTTETVPNSSFTADARKKGVQTLLSIGGGETAIGLQKVAADPALTAALVKEVVAIAVENKYDGIDLDWEFPHDAPSRDGYTRVVAALRAVLDQAAKESRRERPYLLTLTVSADPFFGEWIDAARVAPLVDWLHVMTYDMAGAGSRYAAHNAPMFASPDDPEREWRSVEAAMAYWSQKRGVPPEKLVVGLPMFGRSVAAEAPYEELDPALEGKRRGLPFSQVQQLAGEGWRSSWDKDSLVPWLRSPSKAKGAATTGPLQAIDPEETPELIAYDDRNSIRGKTEWAREQGYRGVFVWALHQDRMPDGAHWLLESAATAWPAD